MKSRASLLPAYTMIALGANALPAHEAHSVDLKNKALILLTIPGQGTADAFDEASTNKPTGYPTVL